MEIGRELPNPLMVLNGCFVREQRKVGSCRSGNTEKSKNHLLDHLVLSCSDVDVWTSTVVVIDYRLGPQRAQQEVVPTGPSKGSAEGKL